MTPEQFLKDRLNPRIDKNYDLSLTGKQLFNLLQEYADLQKPEWIPIIAGDVSGLPDGEIWLTVKTPSGKNETGYATGKWAKKQTFTELMMAWMPYTEPKPYQP